MERLFGRSKPKKTSTSSNPGPASPSTNAAVTNEDEGFAIVSNPNPPAAASNPYVAANLYPNVPPCPYPIAKPELPNGNDSSKTQTGSSGSSAYLDGVPFTLSSRCSGGTDLDEVLARVENIAERIRRVDWAATDYDFRLEKSVMSQDIGNTLRRMHMN